GNLTLRNGRTFTAPGAFANAGTVAIGSGSTLAATSYTQTAGTTTADGTLNATGGVAVNGGVLGGVGTVKGNVTNAGRVAPGSPVGTLTVNGNFTQTAAGELDIEIGGPAV